MVWFSVAFISKITHWVFRFFTHFSLLNCHQNSARWILFLFWTKLRQWEVKELARGHSASGAGAGSGYGPRIALAMHGGPAHVSGIRLGRRRVNLLSARFVWSRPVPMGRGGRLRTEGAWLWLSPGPGSPQAVPSAPRVARVWPLTPVPRTPHPDLGWGSTELCCAPFLTPLRGREMLVSF